jgi:hypothetical protein
METPVLLGRVFLLAFALHLSSMRQSLAHLRYPSAHKIPAVIVQSPEHLHYVRSLIGRPVSRTAQQGLQRQVENARYPFRKGVEDGLNTGY